MNAAGPMALQTWQDCWPKQHPMPTEEEFEAARILYHKDCEEWLAKGDLSDFNCGLEFVMIAYNPKTWLRFFGHACI